MTLAFASQSVSLPRLLAGLGSFLRGDFLDGGRGLRGRADNLLLAGVRLHADIKRVLEFGRRLVGFLAVVFLERLGLVSVTCDDEAVVGDFTGDVALPSVLAGAQGDTTVDSAVADFLNGDATRRVSFRIADVVKVDALVVDFRFLFLVLSHLWFPFLVVTTTSTKNDLDNLQTGNSARLDNMPILSNAF